MPLFARPDSRHTYAHPLPTPHVGKVARRMRVRGVAFGPAGPAGSRAWPRRPASCAVRTVCARTRPHAPFAHDAAYAPPGRGDALPFQGGLDLPGAVAFAAVAPDRAHVAGDRIRTLRPGMPDYPVTGGAWNVRHPVSRRYRATLARITPAFVRIPAPLVLKRPQPVIEPGQPQ